MRVAAELIRLGVDGQRHGLVVRHFLEVWHPPRLVGRIAMEPAAELIEHAAARDLVETLQRHLAERIVLKKPVRDREAKRRKIVEARTAAAAESSRLAIIGGRQRCDYFPAQRC